MEFSNSDSNAISKNLWEREAKIYGSVRRSLSGIYEAEPEFFGPSAIINNLFQ